LSNPQLDHATNEARRQARAGIFFGIGAYGFWGMVTPLYLKAVAAVPPLEVLSHRVLWSVVMLLVILGVMRGGLRRTTDALRDSSLWPALCASTVLISVNWLVYIWAVQTGQLVEASLGYFINPLVNVVLGYVFFGERLRPAQKVSVTLAAIGVAWMVVVVGRIPWLALALAFSFGFYGLLRKKSPVDSVNGLMIETVVLAPLALGWLAWKSAHGACAFVSGGWAERILLVLAGPVTALPLLFFASAARRLQLVSLGFLQYLAPTFQFLIAVFLFGEPFDSRRAVAFVFIWAALLIFSGERLLQLRGGRARAAA